MSACFQVYTNHHWLSMIQEPEVPVNELAELSGRSFKKLIHAKLDSVGTKQANAGNDKCYKITCATGTCVDVL